MTLLDNDQETAIEIPGKKGLRLDATAVSFVRVVEHYCYIHHWNQGQLNSLEVKLPLKEIQVLLPVQMFIQVHRSYLINLSHITRLKKVTRSYELFLRATEESIPISRYRLSEVLPRLQPFLSGK